MLLVRGLLVAALLGVIGASESPAEDAGPKVPPPEPPDAPAGQAEPAEAPATKRTLTLRKGRDGALSGRWIVVSGGATTEKEIKAADLSALKLDFAEAAKLLDSAGGLDVKVAAGLANVVSTSRTESNGRRKTVITAGPKETTLEERRGSELRLRVVTRKSDGVEIVEHEAPSLDALKKLDAAAGKEFQEKQAGGGAGPIQIRAGGVPPQMQQLFINRGFAAGGVDRTIRGYFRGAELQIVENAEAGIVMTITRSADGRPKPEEYTAKDLKDLERQSVEAAALYRRFTGEE